MLLKGKPVADQMKEEIIAVVAERKEKGLNPPKIAILRVGSRPDDVAYESRVLKNCNELGIESEVVVVDDNIDMENFITVLDGLNENIEIHGILLFRPLPPQLDIDIISKQIKPEKDIDCMNPSNMEKLFSGDQSGMAPCTPEAVIEILKFYGYDLTGKNVVIVNRSMVLGKPLAMMFLNENATVTICHSKTNQLENITSNSDIVVTGVGKANFFHGNAFSKDSVVIDVGINFNQDQKMCGDVEFEKVFENVSAITPVPGGVGIVTSTILLKHVMKAMNLLSK